MTRKLRPDDPDGVLYDSVLGSAWVGFIHSAYGQSSARAQFTAETGIPCPAGRGNAIEAMIDTATGYQEHVLFMFAQWATIAMWGMEDAPAAFQAACRERPLPVRTKC